MPAINRDHEHIGKLRDYYAQHKVMPSFAEAGRLLGIRSTGAMAQLVQRLKDAGYVESAPNRRLQPGRRFFEREIADSVRAGLPQPANDVPMQGFNIDDQLIQHPSRTVLLTVQGDSMIDAGLMPGDTVVVLKEAPTKPGDIVVAIVDNAYTVKYLAHDKGGFFLKSGNKAYPPIRPAEEMAVFGKVVGCFRKY